MGVGTRIGNKEVKGDKEVKGVKGVKGVKVVGRVSVGSCIWQLDQVHGLCRTCAEWSLHKSTAHLASHVALQVEPSRCVNAHDGTYSMMVPTR